MDDYEDYDEFCEEYCDNDEEPLYSKEEFKKFKEDDNEWFVLESGDGDIVTNVPLNNVCEIII